MSSQVTSSSTAKFNQLQDDYLILIFTFVPRDTLLRLRFACKLFYNLGSNDLFWTSSNSTIHAAAAFANFQEEQKKQQGIESSDASISTAIERLSVVTQTTTALMQHKLQLKGGSTLVKRYVENRIKDRLLELNSEGNWNKMKELGFTPIYRAPYTGLGYAVVPTFIVRMRDRTVETSNFRDDYAKPTPFKK